MYNIKQLRKQNFHPLWELSNTHKHLNVTNRFLRSDLVFHYLQNFKIPVVYAAKSTPLTVKILSSHDVKLAEGLKELITLGNTQAIRVYLQHALSRTS
jgi:hypothetical protein